MFPLGWLGHRSGIISGRFIRSEIGGIITSGEKQGNKQHKQANDCCCATGYRHHECRMRSTRGVPNETTARCDRQIAPNLSVDRLGLDEGHRIENRRSRESSPKGISANCDHLATCLAACLFAFQMIGNIKLPSTGRTDERDRHNWQHPNEARTTSKQNLSATATRHICR